NIAFNNTGGTVDVEAGQLSPVGGGTNNGAITVAPGAPLNITGNFTQAASGRITAPIAPTAPNQVGQIIVSGAATLDGILNIVLVGGFIPTSGQTFQIMTWSSESGMFSTINNPLGTIFTGSYDPLDLRLTAN